LYAYKVTKLLYGNQQKISIEGVNDYPPIQDSIRVRIVAADSIRIEISDSQVYSS